MRRELLTCAWMARGRLTRTFVTRGAGRSSALCVMALVALPLVSTAAYAHPGVHERVDEVSHEIAANPSDASLYVRRAELRVTHGDFRDARRDLKKARALDPELLEVDLVAGMLELEAGHPTRALPPLSRFLERQPHHSKARALRAEAHVATGALEEAVVDLDHAVAAMSPARPELYVRRAKLLVDLGKSDAALRGLEAAVAKAGPLVVLIDAAVTIEADRTRYDAAIGWVARLPEKLRASPQWQKRLGDLHLGAGRVDQARAAYDAALATLSELPVARRKAPAIRALEADVQSALVALDD